MGTATESELRVTNGLLSKGERAFLEGRNEVENPDAYRRNIRHRVRKRMKQIEEDLQLLEEAGEEDLVEEFNNQFNELGELRREINRLKDQVDEK